MRLSKEKKEAIIAEYNTWFESLYGGTTKEERKELGAVFTPPAITIQMIEKLKNLNGNILDPCCGAGNLLAACIIAGANPECVYGNEYEAKFVEIARARLSKLGVPKHHIHQGDATDAMCLTDFSKDYDKKRVGVLQLQDTYNKCAKKPFKKKDKSQISLFG